jgi:hypothetical protein
LTETKAKISALSLKNVPVEAIAWTVGLACLAVLPESSQHISICPFYNLGFDFCPGCGLGRSISFLFHGQYERSFQTHPLALFAVIVLSLRIFQLLKHYKTYYGKSY